jgi:4-amino-4-deoxy-L-arabinose transferase-like glycosyltransferase
MDAWKIKFGIPSLEKSLMLVDQWSPLILITSALIIFLSDLGGGSLRNWDEAIYAQISKEMIQSSDWITLYHGYKPFFEKPPLLIWITAFFFKLFGVNEFWSRAISAISGTLLVWITYLSGKEIYESRTGFVAGLILLGSYGFVFEARNGETDMLLSLLVSSGIFAYLRLRNGSQIWWYLIWISCALAFMVKFWAGLVLPATLAVVLLLEQKITATLRSKQFWLGILVAAAIVAPWHILVYIKNGEAFIDVYIARDLLERTLTSMEGHYGTPLFYLDAMRRVFSPWYFLFPFALVLATNEAFDRKWKSSVLLAEILFVFGLYTFVVNTKNPSYIFPIFPALSILVARLFILALSIPRSIAFTCIVTAALIATTIIQDKLLILCVLVVFGLAIFFKMKLFSKTSLIPIFTSFIFAVFFLTSIVNYVLGNHRLRLWPIYGMQVSPVAQIAHFAGKENPSMTDPLIGFATEEDWDTSFAVEGPTALFYSNRPIDTVITWDKLTELMVEKKSGEILIAKKYLPRLSKEFDVLVIKEVDPLIYARIYH